MTVTDDFVSLLNCWRLSIVLWSVLFCSVQRIRCRWNLQLDPSPPMTAAWGKGMNNSHPMYWLFRKVDGVTFVWNFFILLTLKWLSEVYKQEKYPQLMSCSSISGIWDISWVHSWSLLLICRYVPWWVVELPQTIDLSFCLVNIQKWYNL